MLSIKSGHRCVAEGTILQRGADCFDFQSSIPSEKSAVGVGAGGGQLVLHLTIVGDMDD